LKINWERGVYININEGRKERYNVVEGQVMETEWD
jgi:hypothetical protein